MGSRGGRGGNGGGLPLPATHNDTLTLRRTHASNIFGDEEMDVFLLDGKEVTVVPVNSGYVKKDKRVFFSYLNTTKGFMLLNFLMNLIFYAAVIIAVIVLYNEGPNEVEHWAQKKLAGFMADIFNYANGAATQICGVVNTKIVELALDPIDCDAVRLFNITREISQSAANSAMQSTSELYIGSFYSVINDLRSSAASNIPPSTGSSSGGTSSGSSE